MRKKRKRKEAISLTRRELTSVNCTESRASRRLASQRNAVQLLHQRTTHPSISLYKYILGELPRTSPTCPQQRLNTPPESRAHFSLSLSLSAITTES